MPRTATSQVLLSTHICIDRTLPLQAISYLSKYEKAHKPLEADGARSSRVTPAAPCSMPGLEDELNALLAGAALTSEGAKDATKDAKKIRRRSKDLEDALESMGSGSAVLGNEISALGKTETDDDVKKLFNEIDADKSGTLEIEELQKALKERVGIEKTKEEIETVFKEVKGEGSDTTSVDFANFKKIIANFKAADAQLAKEGGSS